MRVAVHRTAPWEGLSFFFRDYAPHGYYVSEPLTMTFVEGDDGTFHPPAFTLPDDAAQSLFDQLYAAGYRPSKSVNTESDLLASQLDKMHDIIGNNQHLP